jgi:DNA primase
VSNIPRNVFSGWNQLEQKADILIVTKSLKDCMVWRLFGINAISPQSEVMFLNENQFELLTTRFDKIILNYDNDDQGLKSMKHFSQMYGIKSFIMPDGIKDISDYISIEGYDKTKQLTKNFKDYLV